MSYFKIIVVVLVYKNTDDLKCFFRNNTIPNSRVVVVTVFIMQQRSWNSLR